MSVKLVNEVRRGFYLDSVALMRLSRHIAAQDGVSEAALMMGTPSNLAIMVEAGLLADETLNAAGGDLVIAIAAADGESADNALQAARDMLDGPARRDDRGSAWRPHSIESAFAVRPDANLCLISVAGEYAAAEARRALELGSHVMIFSDNVPVQQEAALKCLARERGLLVMGPDCGTAVIAGTAVAFANVIPRGRIGVVGASGTGIQEVTCLIAQSGAGISHAIGVGGRDLSETVGGISTLMALDALDRDPETDHIVIISKPPAPAIASRVLRRVGASGKSVTVCFLGSREPALPANAAFANTLRAAAESALGGRSPERPAAPPLPLPALAPERRHIRGVYAGGTLCAEAQSVMLAAGELVSSNAPVPGARNSAKVHEGHVLLDLGADEYTRGGRLHPVIDPSVRDAAVVDALHDSSTGVVLFDLILGYGAHENPARHLAELLTAQRTSALPVVVASVTGTEGDPQQRSVQVQILESAGVRVAPSNADAAALAVALVAQQP